jgi:hypothetical protein
MLSSDGTSFLENKSTWPICFGNDKKKEVHIGAQVAGCGKALKIGVSQAVEVDAQAKVQSEPNQESPNPLW